MTAKRSSPEATLQMNVRRYLLWCCPAWPEGPKWTSSLVGTNLGIRARSKAKDMGVQRGWPDMQFLFPDGVTRYIELKAGASLSAEQREFRDACAPHGIFAVCRSVDEVAAQLRTWGAPLRDHPFRPVEAPDWAAPAT